MIILYSCRFYFIFLLHEGRIKKKTRMHSSGMRIDRLLTASQHALGRGGVSQHSLGRGVSAQGGVCPGVSAWGVCGRHPPPGTKGRPPVDRQTPVKKFYIVGIITTISIPKKSLNFCKKLEDIGLFCVATGMYPSFRLLVMSALGFKSRVDSLTCCMLE